MRRSLVCVFVLNLLIPSLCRAQSDPQALAFAAQSIAALTGGASTSDVTLSANITRTVGTDVGTGTATFYGKGQNESRIDMSLSDGNRSEIRNSTNGWQGEWTDSDGTPHRYVLFNCVTDSVWFFPALSSLAFTNDSSQILTYVGQETLNGVSVQHLNSVWDGQPYSATDFYLDANTLLPVAVSFNAHPDNEPFTNIPIQILFSNYQSVNGAVIPFHIQELLNGTVLLDVTLTNVIQNSGLLDSLFAIQ